MHQNHQGSLNASEAAQQHFAAIEMFGTAKFVANQRRDLRQAVTFAYNNVNKHLKDSP